MKKKNRNYKLIKKHPNSHAREIILQAMYQIDIGKRNLKDTKKLDLISDTPLQETQDYVCTLLEMIYKSYDKQNEIIEKYSDKHITQLSTLIKSILHIGITEISNKKIETSIIINDLLELTRKYDGEDSVAFVNGVLDACSK